jgi:hypothetical protein
MSAQKAPGDILTNRQRYQWRFGHWGKYVMPLCGAFANVRFIDEDSLRHVQAKLDKAYRSNSWPFE